MFDFIGQFFADALGKTEKTERNKRRIVWSRVIFVVLVIAIALCFGYIGYRTFFAQKHRMYRPVKPDLSNISSAHLEEMYEHSLNYIKKIIARSGTNGHDMQFSDISQQAIAFNVALVNQLAVKLNKPKVSLESLAKQTIPLKPQQIASNSETAENIKQLYEETFGNYTEG